MMTKSSTAISTRSASAGGVRVNSREEDGPPVRCLAGVASRPSGLSVRASAPPGSLTRQRHDRPDRAPAHAALARPEARRDEGDVAIRDNCRITRCRRPERPGTPSQGRRVRAHRACLQQRCTCRCSSVRLQLVVARPSATARGGDDRSTAIRDGDSTTRPGRDAGARARAWRWLMTQGSPFWTGPPSPSQVTVKADARSRRKQTGRSCAGRARRFGQGGGPGAAELRRGVDLVQSRTSNDPEGRRAAAYSRTRRAEPGGGEELSASILGDPASPRRGGRVRLPARSGPAHRRRARRPPRGCAQAVREPARGGTVRSRASPRSFPGR